MSNRQQLEQAIAIQESLRGTIDAAIVDATIAALRAQLAALDAAPADSSRRAQATILFIDLAGHTGLIQGRDPEEIMEIIDRALERLALPVTRHGGRIVRYQGDGYKAVFGLPTAQEHDPDNAVLAGLDVLSEARAIAAELAAERGMPGFQVRAGIDTGLVLLGGGTEGEDAVTGLPVNLAARLESLAEPGTLLISHHTYQHVRGVFDFEPQPPVSARGFPDPVPVFRVIRRKARSFRTRRRGVEGVETRMIGRAAELATLQTLYGRMIDERVSLSAVVVGDAGLGKSRLLYEFENWGDLQPANVQLYRGRARLETQGLPFGLLRDVFIFRCVIHDDDASAVVRSKLVEGFRAVLGSGEDVEMKAHIVGYLLGYDFTDSPYIQPLLNDARQLRTQGMHFMTEYFRAAAAAAPLLVLLEDLHWADDSSLDAIEALFAALQAQPVMFLSAARPALYERRPDWMAGNPAHRRVDLVQLDKASSAQLVAEILRRAEYIPEQLEHLIVQRAEGNPFYVEELIKMLIEDGVIVKGEESWRVEDAKLAGLKVPPTLTGVLQARLDTLPETERDALQVASVIGRHFWDTAVESVYTENPGGPMPERVGRSLWPSLQTRELVFRNEVSAFEGTQEFVFKHALLRDVTYESVLRRRRRQYHTRAAEWLIATAGSRVEEYADQIAAHYAAAGLVAEEAEWQARAGRLAARQYAAPEAIRALSRALELTPMENRAARFELLSKRRQIYHLLGDRAAEAADLDEQQQLAEAMGDEERLAQVIADWARYFLVTGALEKALVMSERAQTLTATSENTRLRARAFGLWGNSLLLLGRFDEARPALEEARRLALISGPSVILMDITRTLGIVAEEQGDFAAQNWFFEEALRLAREIGDRAGERRALNSLGVAALSRGDYGEARNYYQQSLDIARAIGDRVGQGTVLSNLAVMASNLGDYRRAQEALEEALQFAHEADDRTGANTITLNLAGLFTHLGDIDGALAHYETALRGAQGTGDRSLVGYALAGKGRALLLSGQAAEAREILQQAVELRQEMGQPHLVAETRAFLGEAHSVLGDMHAAVAEAEATLQYMGESRLDQGDDEMRVLLSLYHTLRTVGDERAAAVLERAHAQLHEAAAQMDETASRAYLENVPWNRELMALWQKTRKTGD